MTRLSACVDLQAVFAGALLVGLLATSACGAVRAASPAPADPREVIGTALCERYDAAGRVVQSGETCPALDSSTSTTKGAK